ncbi:hypothetical protein ACHHYP_01007, partial [Achlya hypogyna]
MARVAALAPWTLPDVTTLDRKQRVMDAIGFVYVVAAVGLGTGVLTILATYLENNLFWPTFLSSDMPSAVTALFNERLALSNGSFVPLDMVAPNAVIPLIVDIYDSYPRLVLYTELKDMTLAASSLRQLAPSEVAFMMSQYCWLDLQQMWELAHTRRRQARCKTRYATNAAVYLEVVFRNIDVDGWMDLYGPFFHGNIGDAVTKTPTGATWLEALETHTWVSIETEVAYWQRFGCTTFELQWANLRQLGLIESIQITNAVGLITILHLKTIAPVYRYALWTTLSIYGSFENDMGNFFLGVNASLVLNAPTWFGYSTPDAIEMYNVPYPLNSVNQLLHDTLGPLGSVDLRMLRPPESLLVYMREFHRCLAGAKLGDDAVAAAVNGLEAATLHPVPPKWQPPHLAFQGGNPMCAFGSPYPFVQESFGFDDTCAVQRPYSIMWTGTSVLFALSLEDESWNPCMTSGLSLDEETICAQQLTSAKNAYALLPAPKASVESVSQDVEVMALATLQFVANRQQVGSISVESQLLLPPLSSWRLFGWMAIYEWATGQREAVAFEGDATTFNLLSYAYAPAHPVANTQDIGQNFVKYLHAICTYVTGALLLVLVLLIALVPSRWHSRTTAVNWFVFHRVVGAAWVGRPLLIVRAATALVCLSTATVALEHPTSGGRLFVARPRSLLESMLLSGEALWLLYVLNELLIHITGPATRIVAPWTAAAVFIISVVIDTVAPPEIIASVGRTCELHHVDQQLFCSSGMMQVGHMARLGILSAILVGAAVVCGLVSALRPLTASGPAVPSLLLPGYAAMYLEWRAVGDDWCIDRTSALFGGLLFGGFGGHQYVFDVTLWRSFDAADVGVRTGAVSATFLFPSSPANEGTLGPTIVHRFPKESDVSVKATKWWLRRVWSAVGLTYVVLSLVASAVYMTVTSPQALAND